MSGFWQGLFPGVISTYREAVDREGECSPALPVDAPPLWALLSFGLVWMQASMLTLFMVGGFNVFNSADSIADNSSIKNLEDTAVSVFGVFQRAPNLVFGAPAFVVAASLAINAFLSVLALSLIARGDREILPWRTNFEILSVRLFVGACRLGLCGWLAVVAIIAIHKIWEPTYYVINERILLGAYWSAIALTLFWTILPRIGRLTKREKRLRAQSSFGLVFLGCATFFSLVEAADLSRKYYPLVVKMSVSLNCPKEGNCALFVLAQNTKSIAIDEEVRIVGEFYAEGADGNADVNSAKRQFRKIKFKLVPVDETKAMAVLDPGKEEIFYAKDIVYCTDKERTVLTPSADAEGTIRPHIVGGTGGFPRQIVTASMNRFYGLLLHKAEIKKC